MSSRISSWSGLFLERNVASLPAQATLLTAVETGRRNLDAFPEFLLDVRPASATRWSTSGAPPAVRSSGPPPTAASFIFYQGMFCYFAFDESEPAPDPITPACRSVLDRYGARADHVCGPRHDGLLRRSSIRPVRTASASIV